MFYFWEVFLCQMQRQLNSYIQSHMVAFDLGEFHWVHGRGNWIPTSKAIWLPLILASFIGSTAEATEFLHQRSYGCLWSWRVSSGPWQRQLNSCIQGHMVAFDQSEFHRVDGRGSKNKKNSREWLPPGKQSRWVLDNSYQRQDGFLIIYIKELNCLHKSLQKNQKCCKNNTHITWFMA